RVLRSKEAIGRLFKELAPLFTARNGGYTRIIKYKTRRGDHAPLVIIEWTESKEAKAPAKPPKKGTEKKAPEKKAAPKKAAEKTTEKKASEKKTTRKKATESQD
ncbi:MAG TPA: L17 family ribosomal protein, partial [Deltaproteobacteria bacterium]|nr:L17 family ribosomal protein [Deltaproteobacteria bacterium]